MIIPAHKAAKTIRLSIRSTLFALRREDRIHIFLDGNCTDTENAVKEFRDPRVRIVGKSEHPLGVSAALNLLLESVETEYVSRMDADDITLPWRFEVQRKLLRQYDFVFSTAVVFGKDLKPFPILPQYPIRLEGNSARSALVFGNPFVHPSMIARLNSVARLNGYTEEFGQDYGLWMRAALNGQQLIRTALPCIAYRFHSAQFSSSRKWRDMRDTDTTLERLNQSLLRKLLSELGLASKDQLRFWLYTKHRMLAFEHKGLPGWLRRIKDGKRFEI